MAERYREGKQGMLFFAGVCIADFVGVGGFPTNLLARFGVGVQCLFDARLGVMVLTFAESCMTFSKSEFRVLASVHDRSLSDFCFILCTLLCEETVNRAREDGLRSRDLFGVLIVRFTKSKSSSLINICAWLLGM